MLNDVEELSDAEKNHIIKLEMQKQHLGYKTAKDLIDYIFWLIVFFTCVYLFTVGEPDIIDAIITNLTGVYK